MTISKHLRNEKRDCSKKVNLSVPQWKICELRKVASFLNDGLRPNEVDKVIKNQSQSVNKFLVSFTNFPWQIFATSSCKNFRYSKTLTPHYTHPIISCDSNGNLQVTSEEERRKGRKFKRFYLHFSGGECREITNLVPGVRIWWGDADLHVWERYNEAI